MYPQPIQPPSYLYLALSLFSGTASLYFFRSDVLLFLAWFMLIMMSELQERYGSPRASPQQSQKSSVDAEGHKPPVLSPQLQQSNRSDRALKLELEPLELAPWPTKTILRPDTNRPLNLLPVPSELHEMPQDERYPQDVVNIIRWSLIRATSQKNNASASELPAEDSTHLASVTTSDKLPALENSGPDFHTALASDECERTSDNESRSGNRDKKLGKLHNLCSNIKTSVTDLSSELKEGLELARRAKAALDAKERERTRTVECTSCFDDIIAVDSTLLGCSHAYCKPCFATLVRTAMQNELSWPPKCCLTEIPIQMVLLALGSKERTEYKNRAAEYAIPPADRLYCPGAKCHRFIPASKSVATVRLLSQLKCPYCFLKICRTCRGEAHADREDCPEDYGLNATLESAQAEGWQRCYRCKTMVELTTGCRHITCRCSAEFCYVCGLKWRTCACTETDLVNRRTQVTRRRGQRAERDAARDAAALREQQEIAQAIAEVEAFEGRQVAVRAAERRQREQKQCEEAELLARLEALSAEEERRRRDAEALAQKQQLEIFRKSIVEHVHSLHARLQNLIAFQQRTLISRHETEDAMLKQIIEKDLIDHSSKTQTMKSMLTSNAEKRWKNMRQRHMQDVASLQADLGSREDAMFLQLQTHLQGKPNREEREKRMQNEFQIQLEKEREQQKAKHAVERTKFETQLQQETLGLEKAHEADTRVVEERHERQLTDLIRRIDGERQCFEFVLERRRRLMKVNATRLIADVEEMREPQGITREMAISNLIPFPAENAIGYVETASGAAVDNSPLPRRVKVPQHSESESLRTTVQVALADVSLGTTRSSLSPSTSCGPENQQNTAKAASVVSSTSTVPATLAERRTSSIWSVFGRSGTIQDENPQTDRSKRH